MILSFSQIAIYLDEIDRQHSWLVAGFSSLQRSRGTTYSVQDSINVNSDNRSVLIGIGKRTVISCACTRVRDSQLFGHGRGSVL